MIAATPSCLKIVDKEGRLLAMNHRGYSSLKHRMKTALLVPTYSLVQEDHRERLLS